MEYLKVILTTVLSILSLFLITKIIGYRQMSQMSMFDYINGITIGSIAAELATSIEDNWLMPLISMLIYGLWVVGFSLLSSHSAAFRRDMIGKPLVLFDNDRLYYGNFKISKVDINEFLMQCRNKGYFDLSEVQTVLLESNGRLSILPKATDRPLTATDMKVDVSADSVLANVIIDGNIMYGNLDAVGYDEKWLRNMLEKQGIKDIKNVFLATSDKQGNLNVYKKATDEGKNILD